MNKPVNRAHFVPKVYLKGFTYDETQRVHIYNEKIGVIRSSIKDICIEKFLYKLDLALDGNLNYVEDTLSKIESLYPRLLAKVRKRKILEKADIADLSIFIALQHLRAPRSLNYINNQQALALKEFGKEKLKRLYDNSNRDKMWSELKSNQPKHCREIIEQHPEWKNHLPKELIDTMISEEDLKIEIDPGKNNILRAMLDYILPLADLFIQRSWQFFFAPKGNSFITSSTSAFAAIPTTNGVIRFGHGGFGRLDAAIFFPMSRDICAIISSNNYSQEFITATKNKVSRINRIVASGPDLVLISSSEKLVRKYGSYLSLPQVQL